MLVLVTLMRIVHAGMLLVVIALVRAMRVVRLIAVMLARVTLMRRVLVCDSLDVHVRWTLSRSGIVLEVGVTTRPTQINPFLWFDGKAVEAATFDVALFPNSKMLSISEMPAGPAPGGALVEFQINGLTFGAFDGGPMFEMTPAVSFVIPCDSQDDIDRYWSALAEGGTEGFAGWVTDRFGVSWQVVPSAMDELLSPAAEDVFKAMLGMTKIDIQQLREVGRRD